jgi:hypothetical protein
MTFLGSMTLEQCDDLDEIFAEYKGEELGWVIPLWLQELRATIAERALKENT